MSADYLALTAARESGFQVSARAATSTATGLFQFVEPTWLALVAADGNCLGLSSLVRHIDRDSRGGLRVGSPPVLRMILDLRKNPELSSILAARLAQRNARVFRTHRGRQPTYAELYISHFLGAGNAAELSALAARVPETRADRRFKSAARSNAAIFYDGWRPRTFREVYHILIRGHIGWQVVYS